MKNLFKAISQFQAEMEILKQVRKNDFAKFNYYDYTDVVIGLKPLLQKNGLIYFHSIENRTLTTRLIHVESAEEISSSSEIIEMESKGMNSYQVFGSGISYLKKYHLTSLLGVATDEKSIDELTEERKKKLPTLTDERFNSALQSISDGKITVEKLKTMFTLTEKQLSCL
jgi:hypothetical protein